MVPLVPVRLVREEILTNSSLILHYGNSTEFCIGEILIFAQHTETAPPTGDHMYTSASFTLHGL